LEGRDREKKEEKIIGWLIITERSGSEDSRDPYPFTWKEQRGKKKKSVTLREKEKKKRGGRGSSEGEEAIYAEEIFRRERVSLGGGDSTTPFVKAFSKNKREKKKGKRVNGTKSVRPLLLSTWTGMRGEWKFLSGIRTRGKRKKI